MNFCDNTCSTCSDEIDGFGMENVQSCSIQHRFKKRRMKTRRSSELTDGEMLQVEDLNNLSPEERERVLEDVHGIVSDSAIPTDPEVIQQLLDTMEKKLNNVRSKKAYDMAAFLHPRYAKGGELRLKFLYGLRFDPVEAVRRFVKFFDVKLQLFGPSLLGREVLLSDLSPEAISIVRTGCLQCFPNKVRDRSGRAIFYFKNCLLSLERPLAMLQANFYTCMAAVRELSNEHLSRGIVVVVDSVGLTEMHPNTFDCIAKFRATASGIPIMFAACHICINSPRVQPGASLFQMMIPKAGRVRIRLFTASTHIETLYYLNSFGIGEDIFPLDYNGNMDLEKFEALIQARIANENHMVCDSSSALVPTDIDVIAGRGKSYIAHAGNVAFLKLADGYQSAYAVADKDGKKFIVGQIHQTVLDQGGRFLKLSEEGRDWELLKPSESRCKIRSAFRWKQTDISNIF